ncbi:MAG: hypothetical protein HYX67_07995 [Candidatus Melainabacteria bacterium]|nr:hypothetical protein [Candidatus Melainabacteria bacterium]
MKIEEMSHKSGNALNSGSEAYASAARSAWEKPTGAASVKTESSGPSPESGTSKFDQLTQKSGNNEVGNGAAGEPGGGGSRPIEHKDGSKADGSSAGAKGTASDKNAPKAEGVGGDSKFAPTDKGSMPAENQGRSTGEGGHSEKKVEHKDKQDAALQHLPSLSIV